MQNGNIVLMTGIADGLKAIGDTWSFSTAGSWDRNPSHTYTKRGFYNVTLQANTTYGHNSIRKTGIINVAGPVADFTGTPLTGNAPLSVTFTDNSAGSSITERNWDFGDTNTQSFAVRTHPVHIYQNPGTYSVNLTVINASGPVSGSDTLIRSRYIIVLSGEPVANFTGAPLTGVAPLAVSFIDYSTGASTTSRRWDFGDGNISVYAGATNPLHVYTRSGTYTVTLTALNALGSNQSIRTNYITVVDAMPETPSQIGVSRPANGYWYLDTTKTGTVTTSFQFGKPGDIPVAGDWDGNGISDIGVFRPSAGYWYLDTTKTGAVQTSFHFGKPGDTPVAGDWDGNGISDIGVFRPSAGTWYLDYNTTGTVDITFFFGKSGDIPVTGDWNGDGNEDIGVFRSSTGSWYLNYGKNGVIDATIRFGKPGDVPVVGDWDGNGISDIGVFRPDSGQWYLDTTRTGIVTTSFYFGKAGDTPIIGTWI
jgi:PKD repeat protein